MVIVDKKKAWKEIKEIPDLKKTIEKHMELFPGSKFVEFKHVKKM